MLKEVFDESEMPKVFATPRADAAEGKTHYRVFVGKKGAMKQLPLSASMSAWMKFGLL